MVARFAYTLAALCCLCWTTIAYAIPRPHQQTVLILPEARTTPFEQDPLARHAHVLLAVTEPGSQDEQHVEVPLPLHRFDIGREADDEIEAAIVQTRAGARLPRRLDTVKIIAVINRERQAAPLKLLEHIRCRIVLKKDGREGPRERGDWFSLKDGTVEFDRPESRHFVRRDTDIESYECR